MGSHGPADRVLGVGMVGCGFMGGVHSLAWRNAGRVFDLALPAELAVIAARDEQAVRKAAHQWGWGAVETDWRRLVERPDVGLVDICSPGDTHAEVAVAALAAGKHVLCEKPLANTVSEAETMVAAAAQASADGIRSMVGFNYRRVPALALAHNLVAQGGLGRIRHVRSVYLQDWLVDPEFPLTWRLQRERAGSGALGDLGAHIVDLAQFLTGQQIRGVAAMSETFVSERPLPDAGTGSGLSRRGGQGRGRVTVDDATAFLARLSGGAMATFEASRMAPGRKNAMRIEVNGEEGSLAFDFESMNELWLSAGDEDTLAPGAFRRILVTEADHPYLSGWWPPGHGLGYDHTFTNEVRDMLEAVHLGQDPLPSFADGLVVQRVLDAVAASAQAGSKWIDIPDHREAP